MVVGRSADPREDLIQKVRRQQVRNELLIQGIDQRRTSRFKRHSKLQRAVSREMTSEQLSERLILLEAEEGVLQMEGVISMREEEEYQRHVKLRREVVFLENVILPDLELEEEAPVDCINELNRSVLAISRHVQKLAEAESSGGRAKLAQIAEAFPEVASLLSQYEQLKMRQQDAQRGEVIFSCEQFDIVRVNKSGAVGREGEQLLIQELVRNFLSAQPLSPPACPVAESREMLRRLKERRRKPDGSPL